MDVRSIGDLRQTELLRDLRADLRGVAIDGLAAAHDDVFRLHTDAVDCSGKDLGGGVGIGTAEFTTGNEHRFIRAAGEDLTQHAFCRRGAHGDNHDFAACLILERERRFHCVQVVGVGDGLHGRTVQRAIGVHGNLTGGIGNLLNTNDDFHFTFTSLLISRRGCSR